MDHHLAAGASGSWEGLTINTTLVAVRMAFTFHDFTNWGKDAISPWICYQAVPEEATVTEQTEKKPSEQTSNCYDKPGPWYFWMQGERFLTKPHERPPTKINGFTHFLTLSTVITNGKCGRW
jgi:hypothetical protein